MALIDVDSWLTEYEACERLISNIQTQIYQRNNEVKLSEKYSKLSNNIRFQLKQLTSELTQTSNKLKSPNTRFSITAGELERRERLLENLQSKLIMLKNQFKGTENSEDSSITILHDNALRRNMDYRNVEDLRRDQIQILENQNRGLEILSQSISRQKNLASRLGEEVVQQNDLIENIADSMEDTDARISSETRQIGVINRQDKTWGYWLVIVVLLVIICAIALV